jgi:hypothetical protein
MRFYSINFKSPEKSCDRIWNTPLGWTQTIPATSGMAWV